MRRLILTTLAGLLTCGCPWTAKTEYCNCVIVEEEADFIGDRLRHKKALSKGTLKTAKCKAKDQKIDNGDGPDRGKVRYMECFAGPDCHETGL